MALELICASFLLPSILSFDKYNNSPAYFSLFRLVKDKYLQTFFHIFPDRNLDTVEKFDYT